KGCEPDFRAVRSCTFFRGSNRTTRNDMVHFSCFPAVSGATVVAIKVTMPSTRAANDAHSVLPCIDKERDNGGFAKSFGGFQPVQTLNKHEARTVRPDQDRR